MNNIIHIYYEAFNLLLMLLKYLNGLDYPLYDEGLEFNSLNFLHGKFKFKFKFFFFFFFCFF